MMETTIEAIIDGESTGPIPFNLEPDVEPGKLPPRVIEELRHARAIAVDYAQAYSDAVKAQAEKYKIKPGALKRYINALEADKLAELDEETDDLDRLIGERTDPVI